MNILIAPDSFKECLSAKDVAQHIENGFKKIFPDATYVKVPMADGGEGTVQSIIDALDGSLHFVKVIAPLGDNINAFLGITKGANKVAVIEMAAASGLHLVPKEKRNPLITTSYGTGQLIKEALNHEVEKIIIGIGGSATNDGGVGMLQALGAKFYDKEGVSLEFGGGELIKLASIDLDSLDPRLNEVEICVACDVDNPLCGAKGASAIFGPQKGATLEMVKDLDNNLVHYASVVKKQLGKDIANFKGAGAAGGMGAAFLMIGAKLLPGVDIVINAVNLDSKAQQADLIITGEGAIDAQTIFGKTPIGVAKIGKKYDKPVIGIAGTLRSDSSVVYEHGLDAIFSIVNGASTLESALENAALNLETTSRNIAALYRI